MKKLILAIIVMLSLQGNANAFWYGCAEYTEEQLEGMTEQELKEAYDENARLSELLYEDAAVQSILDKRLYHTRSQQYLDCQRYLRAMDQFIQIKFPQAPPPDHP